MERPPIESAEEDYENGGLSIDVSGTSTRRGAKLEIQAVFRPGILETKAKSPERQTLPLAKFTASILPQPLIGIVVPCRCRRPFGKFCRDLDRKFEITYKLAAATDRA